MSFKPLNINTLLKRFIYGIKEHKNAYNIPIKKIYKGHPELDISVFFHNRKASTPIGPAAGPHTQLAQNIVMSWLTGSRIIELKTIQIDDEIEIGRPCIDTPNICYNVEFSQELKLEQSLREYVKAYMIIEIIKAENIINFYPNSTDTIFEISIGYNLEGIMKDKIRNYINNMMNARPIIDELKKELKGKFEKYKDYKFNPSIVNSITLSTFHGCPPDEIQKIGKFLLSEMNINTTIKMNPTLLGKEKLEEILYKQLGYHHIHINENAYKNDIGFDKAVTMINSLSETAKKHNLSAGVKFSNTLEVINNRGVFKEKVMYMSGEPLHILAITLVNDFRKEINDGITISFSGGISKHNIGDITSLGLVPITICTDLLRPGGYTKIYNYIEKIYEKMHNLGVKNIKDYAVRRYNSSYDNLSMTVKFNTEEYLKSLFKEIKFYTYEENSTLNKKKDIKLDLFDCSTCLCCIQVCPNAANFFYKTNKTQFKYKDYVFTRKGIEYNLHEIKDNEFKIDKVIQIANYVNSCNECGNCETFCPERDAPYMDKPVFYILKKDFDNAIKNFKSYVERKKTSNNKIRNNAFYIEHDKKKPTIYAGIKGKVYSLTMDKEKNVNIFSENENYSIVFDAKNHSPIKSTLYKKKYVSCNIEMFNYHALVTILNGMLNNDTLNNININSLY